MKIFALHNNTGSRHYRIVPQLKEMQRLGHKVILEQHDTPNIEEKIRWADVVIFQMVFSSELVDYAKKFKKKVIFECDDLIHSVPKGHYSYKETKGIRNQIKWWWRIYRTIGKCDGFITTVENLNKAYGWLAKKSLVFQNYCDLTHWYKEYKPNRSDRVRVLWGGSKSHTPDLLWVKPILKEVLEKHPEAQLIYSGTAGAKSTDPQVKFTYGDDIFDGLPENREPLLPAPSNVWPYVLATLQADLGIAPLIKNFFNSCKSQCKYQEYAINKIPGVYAGWHYKNVIQGITGFKANTPAEWKRHITYLIENAKIRKRMGDQAQADVFENYHIKNHIHKWTRFVEEIYGHPNS